MAGRIRVPIDPLLGNLWVQAQPSALDILRSPYSFDPLEPENIAASHLRRFIGSDLPIAIPVDDYTIVEHHVELVVDRVLEKKDTVIIVTGTPGEGKSTFSVWFGILVRQALNRVLGVDEVMDVSRDIVYRQSGLFHRIRLSSRENPSVVIADEGVLIGAQAKAGTYDASAKLEEALSISRIHGVTLFILAPSVWGLASCVRNRRAGLWYHVERRGLSTAFRLGTALPFKNPRDLPFTKFPQPWAKLRWESMEADPIWAPYEAQKIAVTKETLLDLEVEAVKAEGKAGLRAPEWAAEWQTKKLAEVTKSPGESVKSYNTRYNRIWMARKRASTRREQLSATPPPNVRQVATPEVG